MVVIHDASDFAGAAAVSVHDAHDVLMTMAVVVIHDASDFLGMTAVSVHDAPDIFEAAISVPTIHYTNLPSILT